MSGFLTSKQLYDMTGTHNPTDQINWLRENRVPHFVRRDGKPSLTMEMVHSAKVRPSDNVAIPKGFNLSAVNG